MTHGLLGCCYRVEPGLSRSDYATLASKIKGFNNRRYVSLNGSASVNNNVDAFWPRLNLAALRTGFTGLPRSRVEVGQGNWAW